MVIKNSSRNKIKTDKAASRHAPWGRRVAYLSIGTLKWELQQLQGLFKDSATEIIQTQHGDWKILHLTL